MKITYQKIKLELAVTWKISRNSSDIKENYIIKIQNGDIEAYGECAPNIRYGETHEIIKNKLEEILKIDTIIDLQRYLAQSNIPHSLECALQNAHYKYKKQNKIFQDKKGPYSTSFSIPIMELRKIPSYLEKNKGFDSYKIKITNLADIKIINEVRKYTDKKIRIDANEGFLSKEDYLEFDNLIKNLNIEFVEQPFPANKTDWYQEIKNKVNIPIMGDESIEKEANFAELAAQFHSINIKLQKCGGIPQAKKLIKDAKKHGLKVMLGCMIETSLGIRDALYLAESVDYLDLDGSLLLKEDPFNYIELKNGNLYF